MRIVLVALLLLGVRAWAVSQEDYEALVRRATGVSTSVTSSKRVCVCHNGQLDGTAGIAIVDVSQQQRAVIECIVPRFATDGHELNELGCAATGG
jgi:hypothetical protein